MRGGRGILDVRGGWGGEQGRIPNRGGVGSTVDYMYKLLLSVSQVRFKASFK